MAIAEVKRLYKALPQLPQDEKKLVASLSLEELRDWASQKMTEQSRYALSYRFLYNSTSPINRLPTELLAEIVFLWLFPELDWLGRPSYDWMAHMGVCRRWRGIALSTPLLWTEISTGVARSFLGEFLDRSGTCMVNLHLHSFVGRFMRCHGHSDLGYLLMWIRDHARDDCRRIQSLDIVLWHITCVAELLTHLLKISKWCPNITTLKLACDDESYSMRIDLSAFPNLRSLICPTAVYAHCNVPTLLTSLTMVLDDRMSVLKLTSLLRRTPSLESLCLSLKSGDSTSQEEFLPPFLSSARSTAVSKINLPFLRSLDFRGSEHALIIRVLSDLHELQASINISDVRLSPFELEPPIMQTIASLIEACRKALGALPESGTLSIEDTCGATSYAINGEGEQRWSIKCHFERFYREHGNISVIIPEIVRELRPLRFKTLHVSQNKYSIWREPLDWRATFVALPFIEDLKVTSDKAVDALWETLGQQDEAAAPLLASIECHLRRQTVSTLEHIRSAMVECLAYRKQRGAPVRSLGFEAFVDSLSQADRERHESVRERLADLLSVARFEISVEEVDN
ncbi:hypothetical protein CERSUDRAFT_121816 [Gelatoporia subvermispora B]|uniref:Uncharacterized protein n=1 Tax=Ceriporiopsis subvermispora (strain B) TaxID=914234 RepID=M2RM76_CERS8|nr:hypothetical protein CERSUDRAFT_121816 [Gelatoporia subvermispora B]